MKKIALAVLAAASLCALSGCGSTRYTEATTANGTNVKHVSIAAGTSVTTKDGDCINSAGGVCEQQPTQQAAQ
ncbi:hypothetical protein K2B09_003063 [Salmonella enterica subsp. enterica]|nr:hypothetical protein [Salmonella enterica subsp. enterica]EHM3440612.1 hypothetical protein [Salmonella enterica subsp. enterica]EHW9181815.1 hypothetical protein [Salmonella enterica subsp. enterica]